MVLLRAWTWHAILLGKVGFFNKNNRRMAEMSGMGIYGLCRPLEEVSLRRRPNNQC